MGFLPDKKSFLGSSTSESAGLIMTGGIDDSFEYYSNTTVSTLDGTNFDETSVPDLPDFGVGENCLVAIGDDTLVTIGASNYGMNVQRYTRGDDTWEQLPETNEGRESAACGFVRR